MIWFNSCSGHPSESDSVDNFHDIVINWKTSFPEFRHVGYSFDEDHLEFKIQAKRQSNTVKDFNWITFANRNRLHYTWVLDHEVLSDSFHLSRVYFKWRRCSTIRCSMGRILAVKSTFPDVILKNLFQMNTRDWSRQNRVDNAQEETLVISVTIIINVE